MVAERNVTIDPPSVITIPAATATIVLQDERRTNTEISQRFFQNTGANRLYYSEGVATSAGAASCDDLLNYHGYLEPGQQLDCSGHRRIVSVYSAGGTIVAATVRRRANMSHHN
jgi:hypothetical protein